ncbi:MAG: hypothetical protein CFE23_07985 [Flavobacterium sp. BFFFF1]|uniref:tetratricopeptide repeat protein n=1 Tax=unclassified Flavobacterium TaxID=196869 RepID=UPI000BD953B2|nr:MULTISPECIES: tetratricopeptide repeat protein [unclassified Flavobacterium]OYU80654.1 MAG: hypothetical protein CFE23_07985 [Flavobacterium sp. BFFFF1]
MKVLFTAWALIVAITMSAQEKLKFEKRYVQSEDHWVAFPADSLGNYDFGFIYIDQQAGLTLDYSGHFQIDGNGKYTVTKKELDGSMKVRLEPNENLVAFIPDSKLADLEVPKTPNWLHFYKEGEDSIKALYDKGYLYNGWNECEKALDFLEKAMKINPEYPGLRVEVAFAFNCLEQYQKAIDVLQKALAANPKDAYLNKELIYAQAKNGQLDKAESTCRFVFRKVEDKTYNAENAINILQGYFLNNDVKNFNRWYKETAVQIDSNARFKDLAARMKAKLNP